MPEQRQCTRCGAGFSVRPYQVGKYCSNACRKSPDRDRTCERCGTRFRTKNASNPSRFCSRTCKNESQRRLVTVGCDNCGKAVTDKPSRIGRYSGRTFCNLLCQGEWRRKNPTAIRFGKAIPAHVREIYGHECVICGEARVVEYAHKVPAREGGTIHPTNVYVLCPTHHRLLDTKPELMTDDERARLRTAGHGLSSPSCP